MTKRNEGKKTKEGSKRLSVKKEIVKDLDAGPGKAKELGEDQLDDVNGGAGFAGTQMCARGAVFTVACQSLACTKVGCTLP